MTDLSEEQLSVLSIIRKSNEVIADEVEGGWLSGKLSMEFTSKTGKFVTVVFMGNKWRVYVKTPVTMETECFKS